LSPIIYSTEYYWEEGIYLEFRENKTFEALNSDMIESEISYGNYEIKDSFIILKDDVYFGMSKMKDTLVIQDEGIKFILEEPWRVDSGILRINNNSSFGAIIFILIYQNYKLLKFIDQRYGFTYCSFVLTQKNQKVKAFSFS
jgi:hypothetical protein